MKNVSGINNLFIYTPHKTIKFTVCNLCGRSQSDEYSFVSEKKVNVFAVVAKNYSSWSVHYFAEKIKKYKLLILNISMIYKLFRLQIWQMVFLYIYIHIFSNTWYELKMYTDDVMRYINDKSSIISCHHKHSKHLN